MARPCCTEAGRGGGRHPQVRPSGRGGSCGGAGPAAVYHASSSEAPGAAEREIRAGRGGLTLRCRPPPRPAKQRGTGAAGAPPEKRSRTDRWLGRVDGPIRGGPGDPKVYATRESPEATRPLWNLPRHWVERSDRDASRRATGPERSGPPPGPGTAERERSTRASRPRPAMARRRFWVSVSQGWERRAGRTPGAADGARRRRGWRGSRARA